MTSDYPNDDMRSSEPLNLPDPSRQAARGDRPDTPTGQPLPPLRIDASLDPDPWHGDEVEIDLPAPPPAAVTEGDQLPESPMPESPPPPTTDAPHQELAGEAIAPEPIAPEPIAADPVETFEGEAIASPTDTPIDPTSDPSDPIDPTSDAPEETRSASPMEGELVSERPAAPSDSQSEAPPEPSPEIPVEEAETQPTATRVALPVAFDPTDTSPEAIAARVQALLQQEQDLKTQILTLQTERAQLLESQLVQAQGTIGRMIQDGMAEMEQRRQALQVDLEQLERRRDRIRKEMRTTFAGSSQSLAVRVQGFKDYLVGSLQELVAAAEDLQLVREAPAPTPAPEEPKPTRAPQPQFAAGQFTDEARTIQKLIDRYRNNPDYYGPPWRLRRTFEPIHAERVSSWFFDQGGRGALRTLGSRLQNILVVSATASVLRALYGDRLRLLVAIDSPERLGEWRRGLQDCLGISRADFGGPNPGVMLFESSEPLVQKAERLVRQGNLPFIAIDEAEGKVSLSLLQFPLWLAFAPDPRISNTYDSFF